MTLEYELGELLESAGLDAKQRRAVARRLGWDGLGPTTLAGAGAVEGYTRERVRQLEQRVARHLERTQPQLELTRSALEAIQAAAPAGRGELARMLARTEIAEQPFDPRGVVRAAELAGMPVGVIERRGLVLRNEQAVLADTAMPLVLRLVIRDGATSVSAVAQQLATRTCRVRELLEVRDDVTWLDREHNWLLVPATGTRTTTAVRKMLSVTPTLKVADVAAGLGRQRNDLPLPRSVLRSLCATWNWLTLDRRADVVSTLAPLDRERSLSRLESHLVRIFDARGPVLGFARIVRLAEAEGMNSSTASVYLGRSPVFQKVSRGRYALRGYDADIVPNALHAE